jgi:La domain
MAEVSVISNLLHTTRNCENEPETSKLQPDVQTSDATASSTLSSTSDDAGQEEPTLDDQHQPLVLNHLARQLEYYFSPHNLYKDTYLQTLMELNDGCVPVTILVNFTKVRTILPMDNDDARMHAVLQAATEYSDLLQVLSIDTSNGKIATDETPSSATTILAIGIAHKQPLTSVETASDHADRTIVSVVDPPHNPSPEGANTIILRDVRPEVTEEEVRALFCYENCPPIDTIRLDVANCWYVHT